MSSHTPRLQGYHRGSEILSWLQTTTEQIDKYIILDDDVEVYPLEQYLVSTDEAEGLQEEQVELAISILNS